MNQTAQHQLEIKVVIKCYDNLPKDSQYLGCIEDYNDAKSIGCVQAGSIGECIKELGISLSVLEQYRKTRKS